MSSAVHWHQGWLRGHGSRATQKPGLSLDASPQFGVSVMRGTAFDRATGCLSHREARPSEMARYRQVTSGLKGFAIELIERTNTAMAQRAMAALERRSGALANNSCQQLRHGELDHLRGTLGGRITCCLHPGAAGPAQSVIFDRLGGFPFPPSAQAVGNTIPEIGAPAVDFLLLANTSHGDHRELAAPIESACQ